MRDFFHDVKHSLRAFWNTPGFTFAAVAALALGIGANTAIFSIVDAVLLKPVPFPEPDRLVVFQQTGPQGAFSAGSPAKFQFWRDADQRRPGRLGLPLQRPELHRRRRARAAARRPGVGRLLQALRRADRARPRVQRGRGPARRHPRHAAQPRPLDAAVRRRPEHPRQDHLAQRRSVHDRRHRRTELRRLRVRHAPRAVDSVPARPAQPRPGPLLPGRRAVEAGRQRPAGAGAPVAVVERVQAEVPERAAEGSGLQRRAAAERDRPRRAVHAVDPARRGQPRAAHRLRQRRQPAARARHGTPARDRDPRRDRRRPRAHRPAAADGERPAVARRRDHRAGPRHGRHPRAARAQHGRPAAHGRGRFRRHARLARARVHARGVDRHRRAVRSHPRAPGLARGPQRHAEGEQQPRGHGLPPEQDALDSRGHRSRARADPARRLGAARADRGRPARGRIPASIPDTS